MKSFMKYINEVLICMIGINIRNILLKGWHIHVPDSIYLLATNKLLGTAKKIMYGEACSFVPVWKTSFYTPISIIMITFLIYS